ncbi:MAG: formate--tetrahydrofolate ligase, partial [Sandaracinaceae bacterium]
VAEELGVPSPHVLPYGRGRAKVALDALSPRAKRRGKLVLVSAMTPTPAGEGKTTTSIALSMGLRRLGVRAVACLREPSLGPVFGIKGGGTGGGRSVVEPEEAINLHFTGDLHAIGSAHNLLAALVDNDLHFGAKSGLDARHVTWPRVVDMNDRALRNLVIGLQGQGVTRETRFDITAASEVMAILCLAESFPDLRERLGRIVVGHRRDKSFVTAKDLAASEAMTALLIDALAPNLAQTAEGGPAIVHGGPFANIAHGCSSVLGTRLGLQYGDVVVTEAGFGFDLGGEKFLDIKCRSAGLWPDLLVMVASLRALKMHGGVRVADASGPNLAALERGFANLDAHLDAAATFGLEPVVAINRFADDPADELSRLARHLEARGVAVAEHTGFAEGGAGAVDLGRAVLTGLENAATPEPRFLYGLDESYEDKLHAIATKVYGADGVDLEPTARRRLRRYAEAGYDDLPVCVAKTFKSLSDDGRMLGRPSGFRVTVRDVRLSAGAGFVVAVLGETMTMPGLPRRPASTDVEVHPDGAVTGLMR